MAKNLTLKTVVQPIKYISVPVPKGAFKLSPSGLGTFARNPWEWWNGSEFKGNLNSIKGTCVHTLFETFTLCIQNDIDLDTDELQNEIKDAITKYAEEQVELEIITIDDFSEVINEVMHRYYSPVLEWVRHHYSNQENVTVQTEIAVKRKLSKYVTLAGSSDAIVTFKKEKEKHVIDYKWTSRKISSIEPYLPQLLCYAYAAKGVTHVNVVQIRYTKKDGVLIETMSTDIRKGDLRKKFVKFLRSVTDVVALAKEKPELVPVLFRTGVDFMGKFKL